MSDHGTATSAAFGAHAGRYDSQRRRLIPPYDAFYGTAVEALALIPGGPGRVLDLGAGTGLLSEYVAERFPDAELTLLDGSADMIDGARARLGDRARYVVQQFSAPLPAGPWCAVVSSLAIHHSDDDAKRALFAQTFDALAPGGLFVNAEMICAPTPWLEEHFAAWQHDAAVTAGSSPQEWADAEHRMTFDRLSTVEDQLSWLRQTGFSDVAVLFQDHRFAVMIARRPPQDDVSA